MGKKSNPTIFRLGKINSWKSKYLKHKSQESAIYSFQDVEIQKYINKFFKNNGLTVHNCKLFYYDSNSLHIFISYYLTNNSVLETNIINKHQELKLRKRKLVKQKKIYTKQKKNIKL